MREFIVEYGKFFLENWKVFLIGGLIVVSIVIALMGCLKPLFNKIPNKLVRKFCLAFGSIALSLPMTLIMCLLEEIDLSMYWVTAVGNGLATIVCYWLYENTLLRNLFQFVVKKVLTLVGKLFVKFLKDQSNGLTQEGLSVIKAETGTLKKEITEEIIDLKNL